MMENAKLLAGRSPSIYDEPFIYCPGCSHGVAHRIVAEVVDEMGLRDRAVGVSSIGCSVRIWRFLDLDFIQGMHGRGLAVATGIKRAQPDKIVFSYQGDGDLAAIGMGETVHAAARGENITVIFINNTVFGATGGQMAPTTLPGQWSVTYPEGRDPKITGMPIRLSELLAQLDSTNYITRVSLHSPAHIRKAKIAVRKAFQMQIEGKGFSMVEMLASCPSNLKLSPADSLAWVEKNMIPYYPLGDLKAPKEEAK